MFLQKLLFAMVLLCCVSSAFGMSDAEFLQNCFNDIATCCAGFPANFQSQSPALYAQFANFMTATCAPYGN